jgi:hypothetical protein
MGLGCLRWGRGRDRFRHGSLVGDETFLTEAGTGTSKLPTLTDWTWTHPGFSISKTAPTEGNFRPAPAVR